MLLLSSIGLIYKNLVKQLNPRFLPYGWGKESIAMVSPMPGTIKWVEIADVRRYQQETYTPFLRMRRGPARLGLARGQRAWLPGFLCTFLEFYSDFCFGVCVYIIRCWREGAVDGSLAASWGCDGKMPWIFCWPNPPEMGIFAFFLLQGPWSIEGFCHYQRSHFALHV